MSMQVCGAGLVEGDQIMTQEIDYEIDLFDHRQSHAMWDEMAEMRQRPVAQLPDGIMFTSLQRRPKGCSAILAISLSRAASGYRGAWRFPRMSSSWGRWTHQGTRHCAKPCCGRSTRPWPARASPSPEHSCSNVWTRLRPPARGIWSSRSGAVADRGRGAPARRRHRGHTKDRGLALGGVLHRLPPARLDHTKPDENQGLAGSAPELCAYFDQVIAERGRIRSGRSDLDILRIEVNGEKVSHERIRTLSLNFMTGAISLTMLLGNLMYRFLSDEEFHAALKRDRTPIPAAIEESLRFEPPIPSCSAQRPRKWQLSGRSHQAR